MTTIQLVPYKHTSTSCKLLQQALKEMGHTVYRITPDKISTNPETLVINWGNSQVKSADLNSKTFIAMNKTATFFLLSNLSVSTLEWTTYKDVAQEWIDKGKTIIGRKLINSSKGKGIIIFEQETITSDKECPLYTLYKKKSKEFRVYVFNKEVIDILEKRKRIGFDNVNTMIRSFNNGWVFCRENVNPPEDLNNLAINACNALNLDFGGIDIIWNKKENKSYVLEVNTAPGIQGTSIINFAKAIHKFVE